MIQMIQEGYTWKTCDRETGWAQGEDGALSPLHCWTTSVPGSVLGTQCWQESKMGKAGSLPSGGTALPADLYNQSWAEEKFNCIIQTFKFL